MLSIIRSSLKDNSGESTYLYIIDYLFGLCIWQVVLRHLRDDAGSLDIPDDVLDEIAKCLLPNIVAFVNSERGKAEFAKWKAEQEEQKALQKKRAKTGEKTSHKSA